MNGNNKLKDKHIVQYIELNDLDKMALPALGQIT